MNLKSIITLLVLVMLCSSANAETTLWVHTSGGESIPFLITDIEYIDFDGLNAIEDLEQAGSILNSFRLLSNHPNPFNPSTNINYELTQPGNVEVIIYDVMGKEITTLVSDHQIAGSYQIQWKGDNSQGVNVAGGMYFYQLSVDEASETKKMLLIK